MKRIFRSKKCEKLKKVSSMLILLCLVSCVGYQARMTRVMDSWLGQPVTQVIQSWGPPTTVYDEGAYKVYVWHSSRTYGGGTSTREEWNSQTGQWEKVAHGNPVKTANTYRMFWVASDGTCARYKFGNE